MRIGNLVLLRLAASLVLLVLQGYQSELTYTKEPFCELPDENSNIIPYKLDQSDLFRAAVYEHRRIDLDEPKSSVEANLEAFENASKFAAKEGANVLVFPEDGLFCADKVVYIESLVEEIPDPEALNISNNNPCIHGELYARNMPILTRLSCMARQNNLYLVANFGTKQSCDPGSKVGERTCPENGRFLFNTNVVFDSDGGFIRRYRKYNIFIEVFDRPPSPEYVYFDSPYGRFGLITCFDMLFSKPTIDLIEKFKVNTILFPTWWFDEVPLLTATQVQDAWSYTNKVNLVASNIHILAKGSVGSSISSGNRSISTSPADFNPRLLLANLPKLGPGVLTNGPCGSDNFNAKSIELEDGKKSTEDVYKRSNLKILSSDSIYRLKGLEGSKTECSGTFCCTFHYKLATHADYDLLDRIIVIVRDGTRKGHFMWYEQICALVTLENHDIIVDQKNGTTYSLIGLTGFETLILQATFNTQQVYPITSRNVSIPVQRQERDFSCKPIGFTDSGYYLCQVAYTGNPHDKLLSFGMYGRVYDRDEIDYKLNTRHLKEAI